MQNPEVDSERQAAAFLESELPDEAMGDLALSLSSCAETYIPVRECKIQDGRLFWALSEHG